MNNSSIGSNTGLFDLIDHLDNIVKIKDNHTSLESQEPYIQQELDRCFRENDEIFAELIKKQSEEAKGFNDLADNMRRRLRHHKTITLYQQYTSTQPNSADFNLNHQDIKEHVKKVKENLLFLKPLAEED